MSDHPTTELPPRGSRWRHHKKGTIYVVSGHARDADDGSPVILYVPWEDSQVTPFARPFAEWHQVVAYDERETVRRFTRVEDGQVAREEAARDG